MRGAYRLPELRALDLADGDVTAQRIAPVLQERGIETPIARVEMIVRARVTPSSRRLRWGIVPSLTRSSTSQSESVGVPPAVREGYFFSFTRILQMR